MPIRDPIERAAYMAAYTPKRRETYRLRMASAIALLGGKCKCGSDDRLQVDHIDPATKAVPSKRLMYCAEERFWAEIAKCQVLCFDCHVEKSRPEISAASRRRWRLKKLGGEPERPPA